MRESGRRRPIRGYGNHHTTSNSYTNGNGDEYAKANANAKAAADTASSAVRIG